MNYKTAAAAIASANAETAAKNAEIDCAALRVLLDDSE